MQQLRLGITIGRKVGGSVVRNKFKRWSKNIVRDYVKQRTTDEATHVTNNTAVGKTSGWSSKEGFDVNIVFKPVSNEFYKKLQFLHYKKALLLLFDKALK